jgi:plastocyanin
MILARRRDVFQILTALWALIFTPVAARAQNLTVKGQVTVRGVASHRSAENADAVVWLTSAAENPDSAAAHDPPAGHYQLLQQGKRFRPHILVVPVGAVVEFPNHDPFFHNVFSLFDGKRFDLGLYEAGSTKRVHFNSPGVSYIFCNIHPEMSAVVIAINTPYYARSTNQGDVVIENVPPGRYDLSVWHERCLPETLKQLSRVVVISSSSTSLGQIVLVQTADLLAKHKNKYDRDYDANPPQDSSYAQP